MPTVPSAPALLKRMKPALMLRVPERPVLLAERTRVDPPSLVKPVPATAALMVKKELAVMVGVVPAKVMTLVATPPLATTPDTSPEAPVSS